jgi:hypothetical protein
MKQPNLELQVNQFRPNHLENSSLVPHAFDPENRTTSYRRQPSQVQSTQTCTWPVSHWPPPPLHYKRFVLRRSLCKWLACITCTLTFDVTIKH